MNPITCFQDFCSDLLQAGFSMGGENAEGIFSLCSYFNESIAWHTEEKETDPWEWRMRVLNEREDIAYAKLFFRKSGYITREWYPYFLSLRRKVPLVEAYYAGNISEYAKRIYELIEQNGRLPLHLIKQMGNFGKEDKAKFERAITDLQMGMYITMCGQQKKHSLLGEEYGWSSTSFCTVEEFWGEEVFYEAGRLSSKDAESAIIEQILRLNPQAKPAKMKKFILGA